MIGIERVVHVVHDAGGELSDRGETPLARARFLEREQLVRALLHHALETLGFRRHALVELGGTARFLLERFASCVFTVTSRSTVTAPRIFPCSS